MPLTGQPDQRHGGELVGDRHLRAAGRRRGEVHLLVLPPLLYAGAEDRPWRELKAVWKPVRILAIGLVPASAAAVG